MTSSLNSPNTPVPEQAPPPPPPLSSVHTSNNLKCCSHSDCPVLMSAEPDSTSRIPNLNRRKSNGSLIPTHANAPPVPASAAAPPSPIAPRRCLACARREALRATDGTTLTSQDRAVLPTTPSTPTSLVNPHTPHPSLPIRSPIYHLSDTDQHGHSLLEAERDATVRDPRGLDAECGHYEAHWQPNNGLQRCSEPDQLVFSRLPRLQQQQKQQQWQQKQPQLDQPHAAPLLTYGNHRSDDSNPPHPEKDHTQPKCHSSQENNRTGSDSNINNNTYGVRDHRALRQQSHRAPPPAPPLLLATSTTTASSSAVPNQSMILLPPLSLDVTPSHASPSTPSPTTPTNPRARMTPPTTTNIASSSGKGQQFTHTSTVRRSSLSSPMAFSTVRRRTSLDQSSPSTNKHDVTVTPSRVPTRRGSIPLLDSSKIQRPNMSSPSESKSSPSQRSASRVSGTWSTSSHSPVRSSDTVRLYQPVKPAIGNTPSSPVQRRRQRQRQQPVQSIFENSSTLRTPDDDERRVDDGDKEERQVEQKNQEEDEVDYDDDLDEGERLEDSPESRPAVDVELLEQVNKISQHKLDAIDKIMGAKHNSRFTISRKKGQKILAELEKEFGSDLQDTTSDVASPNYDSLGTQDTRRMMAGQSTIRHHDGCETPDGTKTPTAFSTLAKRAVTDDPDATIKIRLTGTARSRPPTLIMQYARSESPKEPALQPILNPEQFVTRRFAQWSTVSRLGRRTKKRKSENLYPPSTSSSSSAVSQPVRISPSSSQGSLSSTDQDGNVVIKSLPSDLTSCRAEHAMVPEATQPSKPTSRHILSILELFDNKGYDRPKGSTVSSNQSKGKEIASQSPADNQGINSPAWKMAAKVLFHSSSATVAGPSSRKKVEVKGEESSVQQKTTNQDPTVTRGRQGWMTTKRIFQTLTRSNKQKTTKAATEENTAKPSELPTIVSSGIESFPSQPPSLTIKRFLTSRRKMLSQVLFGSDKTDPPCIETGEAPVSSATTQPSKSEVLGPPVSLPNKVSSAPTPAPASLASAPAATSVPAPVSDSRPGFVSITSLTNVPPPGRRNSLHSFIGRSRSSSDSSNQQQPLLQSVMPPTTISLSSSTVRRNSTQGLMTSMSSTNHQEPLRRHLRVATTNSSQGIGPPLTTSSSSAAGSASKLGGLYQRVEPQSTSRSTSTTTSNSSAATAISSEARESRRSYSSGSSTPVQSNSRAASPIHKLAALFAQDKPATTETAVPASAISRGTGHSAVSISAPSSPSLKKPDRHNLGTFEVAVSAALPPRPFMQNAVGSIVADTVSPFQQLQWHRSRRLWSRNSSADMYSRYANSSRNNSLNNRRNSSHSTATLGTVSDSPTLSSRRFSSNAEPWLSRLEGSAQPGDQSTTPSSHTSQHQGRPYDNHHHHHYHHRHHQAGLDSVTERHDFLMGDNAFHVPGSTTRSIQDLQEEANDVLRHGGLHLELPLPVSICAAEYDGQRQQSHQQLQQQPQKQQQLQDGTGRSAPKKSVMSLKIAQQELFSTPQHRDSPSPQPNHATPLGDVMGSPKNSGMDNNLHNNNSNNNNKNSGTKALQLDLPQTPWLLLATTPERMDHDHGMYRFGGDSPQPRRWGRQDQQQQLQQQHKHRRHHGADSSNSDVDDAEEGDDDDSAEEDDEVTIGSLIEDGHARFTPGLSSASKPLYFDASWDRIKHNNGR